MVDLKVLVRGLGLPIHVLLPALGVEMGILVTSTLLPLLTLVVEAILVRGFLLKIVEGLESLRRLNVPIMDLILLITGIVDLADLSMMPGATIIGL